MVVSTATRSTSVVASAPVFCATARLFWSSAASWSPPKRWRQRASHEPSKGSACQKACSPQNNWKYGFSIQRAQRLVRRAVHGLEDQKSRHQSGRQTAPKHPFPEIPVDLARHLGQRMAKSDDPVQGRPEQILPPFVPRPRLLRLLELGHASSENHDPSHLGGPKMQ